MPSPSPRVVLGAALQAQHALSLAQWAGLSIDDADLYEDGAMRETGSLGRPIRGTIKQGARRAERSKEPCIVAIGTRGAAFRWRLFQRLRAADVPLLTFVHASVFVAPDATVGANTLVMPGCVLSAGAAVGSLVCMFANVTVEHDGRIGDNVTLGPGATLSGGAVIEPHAFVGAGAVIGPGVRVGSGALVGAGAVVMRDVTASMVVSGVPGRPMRPVRVGDDCPTPAELATLGAA